MNVTLITGASGGIGKAIAQQMAALEHDLLLVARSKDKLEKLCQDLSNQFGIEAQYIVADLTQPDTPELIFSECQKRNLTVDQLINNAGIGSGGEFADLNLESEQEMMQLNMNALVSLTHFFLREMKTRKKGTIVNVASMAAFLSTPYMATYGATKAFVRSFTTAITEECKPYNVKVLLFCPGLTDSNFMSTAGLANSKGDALTSGAAIQTPGQVAKILIWALHKNKNAELSITGIPKWYVKNFYLKPSEFIARAMAKRYRKRLSL